MESDTPRTDAVSWIGNDGVRVIRAADAQILERELAASTAETIDLFKQLAAAIEERDGYLEGNRQALRALAEANEIAARYKAERDEARREACAFEAINRWNEAHPKGIMSPCAVERIAREIAVERGWDCFAAEEGGGA